MNRRLTLNLGLRYEFESGFIDAGFKQPLEGLAPFFDSRTRKNPKLSFGPRVGFAYDLRGNGNTVLRGGFGIYHDSTVWEIGYIDRTFNGVKYFIDVFSPTQPDVNDPSFQVTPPPPGGFAVDGHASQPYTEQWSVGVGQQLPWGVVLDSSYVHILGIHGWMSRELNPGGLLYPTPIPLSTKRWRASRSVGPLSAKILLLSCGTPGSKMSSERPTAFDSVYES